MMVSNTNYTPNLIKYYVLATITFLIAVSFHASVYHRFGEMEKGLNEAARIKFMMEWDEMKALTLYQESVQLHREGIRDTILAYEYATEADSLLRYAFEEEEEVQKLNKDANEKEQQAQVDTRKSAMYGMSNFRNNRDSVGSTITGMELARQAEDENERSVAMMNHTVEQETEGKNKLRVAQAALEAAERETFQNHTKIDKGVCKWASAVCNIVNRIDGPAADGNQTQTLPVTTATDAVIKANKDIQDALKEIHDAELEHSRAIELHRNASIHANLSTEILQDAQAFKNQSNVDMKHLKEHRTSAAGEEAEAKREEERAENEEANIIMMEYEYEIDVEHSLALLETVVTDRYEERIVVKRLNTSLDFVARRKIEFEQKTEEANNHVARAGWEALVASVAGACLLTLVITRIVATFRYQRPLQWVLRDQPYFPQDLLYLVCHVWIFLLAMGYVGELLMDFHNHNNITRAGITIIFALNAAVLQVTLLHAVPSMYNLFRDSRLQLGTIRLFVEQVVIKKGAIIALVSAIEMLLCWCWMGTVAFKRVHKFNTYAVWLVVLCLSACYVIYVQTYKYAVADDLSTYCGNDFGVPSTGNNDGQSDKEDERNSLLPASFQVNSQESGPGSFIGSNNMSAAIQSSKVSAESPASMRSVPLGSTESDDDYGSLTNIFRSHLSTSPLNFSWESELEKIRLLFEFLIASLAIWIVRRDLVLIRKLSPLATGLVWGRLPLWILNLFLFITFATFTVALTTMKFGRENSSYYRVETL